MNKLLILIASLVAIGGSFASCADRMPRGVDVDEERWKMVKRLLADHLGGTLSYSGTEPYIDSLPVEVDYAVTNRSWMAAVISQKNDSVCRYGRVIGQMSYPTEFHFTWLSPSLNQVAGDEFNRYRELMTRDSLWTLFADEPFWGSEASMERLFWSDKTRQSIQVSL